MKLLLLLLLAQASGEFNGTSQYFDVGNFNIATDVTYTVSIWSQSDTPSAAEHAFSSRHTSNGTEHHFIMGPTSATVWRMNIRDAGSANCTADRTTTVNGTSWLYGAGTRNNTACASFANAVKTTGTNGSLVAMTSLRAVIGASWNQTAVAYQNFFDGRLAWAAYWNRELSDNEIQEARYCMPVNGPEHLYSMWESSGTIPDLGYGNLDGTRTGVTGSAAGPPIALCSVASR